MPAQAAFIAASAGLCCVASRISKAPVLQGAAGTLLVRPLQYCALATQAVAEAAATSQSQGSDTKPAPDQSQSAPQQLQTQVTAGSSSQPVYKEVLGRLQLNKGLQHQDESSMSLWEKMHSKQEWQFQLLLAKHRQAQQQVLSNRPAGASLGQLIGGASGKGH